MITSMSETMHKNLGYGENLIKICVKYASLAFVFHCEHICMNTPDNVEKQKITLGIVAFLRMLQFLGVLSILSSENMHD